MIAIAFLSMLLAQQQQPQDPLLEWMNRQAQQQLDARDRTIAAIRTSAEADRRKAEVREKLLRILGGLPEYRGPLRARVTGTLQGKGYAIEKVIFESLPGFWITGNVYRPEERGRRYPGILVPSGHTQEGKPEPQILAANFALKGFVALTYDPIGQGEREQTYLPQLGRAFSGGGGNEHLELGARSILIGQSVARYFIHDARRAADYLVSRADVDPGRLAVAGCSGGGAITMYVAVFDSRMKAAAPACAINSFHTLFPGPTADSEMSLPQFLANGLDIADFFEVAAPLPWLLLATTEDYFTPAGAKTVYDEVRRWYSVYGVEDRLRFHVAPGPHGTPKESREEIYKWMFRWLTGGKGDPSDQTVNMFTNHELQVTASGNVDGEPGSRKLHQVILEEYRAKRQPRRSTELRERLVALGVRSSGAPKVIESGAERIRFESEPGVVVQGKLYRPAGTGRKPAVIVVEEKRLPVPLFVQRSQSTTALCEALAKAGNVVLELDVTDSPDAWEGRPFLGNWVTNERADLIGRNLAAMRAHDILAAMDVLSQRPDVDPSAIRGYGRGVKGLWMLMAAAVDPRLKRVWLDRTPWRYDYALESPQAGFLFDALIPGLALHWDVPDFLTLAGESRVFWTDPTAWMYRIVYPGSANVRHRYVGQPDTEFFEEFLR